MGFIRIRPTRKKSDPTFKKNGILPSKTTWIRILPNLYSHTVFRPLEIVTVEESWPSTTSTFQRARVDLPSSESISWSCADMTQTMTAQIFKEVIINVLKPLKPWGGGTLYASPPCLGFLPSSQNIITQPIPENSWPCKTFCCGCNHGNIYIAVDASMKKKSKFFVLSPLRTIWNMGLKTGNGLMG